MIPIPMIKVRSKGGAVQPCDCPGSVAGTDHLGSPKTGVRRFQVLQAPQLEHLGRRQDGRSWCWVAHAPCKRPTR
jgi:hypothetical protein